MDNWNKNDENIEMFGLSDSEEEMDTSDPPARAPVSNVVETNPPPQNLGSISQSQFPKIEDVAQIPLPNSPELDLSNLSDSDESMDTSYEIKNKPSPSEPPYEFKPNLESKPSFPSYEFKPNLPTQEVKPPFEFKPNFPEFKPNLPTQDIKPPFEFKSEFPPYESKPTLPTQEFKPTQEVKPPFEFKPNFPIPEFKPPLPEYRPHPEVGVESSAIQPLLPTPAKPEFETTPINKMYPTVESNPVPFDLALPSEITVPETVVAEIEPTIPPSNINNIQEKEQVLENLKSEIESRTRKLSTSSSDSSIIIRRKKRKLDTTAVDPFTEAKYDLLDPTVPKKLADLDTEREKWKKANFVLKEEARKRKNQIELNRIKKIQNQQKKEIGGMIDQFKKYIQGYESKYTYKDEYSNPITFTNGRWYQVNNAGVTVEVIYGPENSRFDIEYVDSKTRIETEYTPEELIERVFTLDPNTSEEYISAVNILSLRVGDETFPEDFNSMKNKRRVLKLLQNLTYLHIIPPLELMENEIRKLVAPTTFNSEHVQYTFDLISRNANNAKSEAEFLHKQINSLYKQLVSDAPSVTLKEHVKKFIERMKFDYDKVLEYASKGHMSEARSLYKKLLNNTLVLANKTLSAIECLFTGDFNMVRAIAKIELRQSKSLIVPVAYKVLWILNSMSDSDYLNLVRGLDESYLSYEYIIVSLLDSSYTPSSHTSSHTPSSHTPPSYTSTKNVVEKTTPLTLNPKNTAQLPPVGSVTLRYKQSGRLGVTKPLPMYGEILQ